MDVRSDTFVGDLTGQENDSLAGGLPEVDTIYHEPSVPGYARGREILARFSNARSIEVPSQWNIPKLHGDSGSAGRWNETKRTVLVLGAEKGLSRRPFYRSCDFVAPSQANGCAMACSYCYVARRKGCANPITAFVDIDDIPGSVERHASRLGIKLEPTLADPDHWVYELGTNSDLSVDAAVSDNVQDFVELFGGLPNAKATFATKYVNRDLLGSPQR